MKIHFTVLYNILELYKKMPAIIQLFITKQKKNHRKLKFNLISGHPDAKKSRFCEKKFNKNRPLNWFVVNTITGMGLLT